MAKILNSVFSNRKEQFWRKHIVDWRKSDLSQAEYCRRNKLSTQSFRYRLGRIRKQPEPVCFVPVSVKSQASESSLSLVFGDSYRLDIRDGFSSATLENAVRVLRNL